MSFRKVLRQVWKSFLACFCELFMGMNCYTVITVSYMLMKKYVCTVCNWVYDPAKGDPEGGIVPGTPFEEIPYDWVCPLCGVGKDDFEELEE